ncbi:MAG: hypothetical protein ACREBB_01440 [Nitrosotalea sp.]
MSEELANLFKGFNKEEKEKFLEGMSILDDAISRKIIAKAASPHSPVAIDEFPEFSETSMARHLHLLAGAKLLQPVWEGSKKKFAITDFGRAVDTTIHNDNPQ